MATSYRSWIAAAGVALLAGACTVEQTEEGRAPEIDPGEAPSYEIEPADVDLGWDTTQVRVPDLDVRPRPDTVPRDTLR